MNEQQRDGIRPRRTVMDKVQWHWICEVIDYRLDNYRELLEPYQSVSRLQWQFWYV